MTIGSEMPFGQVADPALARFWIPGLAAVPASPAGPQRVPADAH